VSSAFTNGNRTNMAPAPASILWWRGFDDPMLNGLVDQAVTNNPDLRIATAHVLEARALRMGAVANLFPVAQAQAGWTKSATSVDASPIPLTQQERELNLWSTGFDATWELDLFGHVRRSIQADTADLMATIATRQDVLVSLIAEVARNYFELRGAQRRLAVARENLDTERQTLDLTKLRGEVGRGSDLDVERSLARLKATEATIPPLEAAERQANYRLAVLLGERPGALDSELRPAAVATYAKALPIGDPAELLRRRPDVRAAERQLAAATARVGVATADLFPRVNITGFVGFLSGDVGRLFSTSPGNDARAWSVTPAVSWAAFDLGSVRARLRATEAQSDAAAANYERVVLTALEDTENSLVAYRSQQARLKSLSEQAAASRRAADLAATQYREGVADFLVLLDAERTQLEAEDSLAQAETGVNVSVVAIYKALGGVGQPASDGPARLARAP